MAKNGQKKGKACACEPGKTVLRDAKGRFTSGTCGGGRKRTPEALRDRCRELTDEIIDAVASILRDTSAANKDRLRAAEILLERGYGRPRQAIDLSASDDGSTGIGVIIMPPVQGEGS